MSANVPIKPDPIGAMWRAVHGAIAIVPSARASEKDQRHVLIALLLLADNSSGRIPRSPDDDGGPEHRSLAALVPGMSEDTISACIKALEDAGYVTREKIPGRRPVFTVELPAIFDTPRSTPQGAEQSEPSRTRLHRRVRSDYPAGCGVVGAVEDTTTPQGAAFVLRTLRRITPQGAVYLPYRSTSLPKTTKREEPPLPPEGGGHQRGAGKAGEGGEAPERAEGQTAHPTTVAAVATILEPAKRKRPPSAGPLFDRTPIEPKPAKTGDREWRGALGEAFRKGLQRRERIYRGQDFVALQVLVEAHAVDHEGVPLTRTATLAWLERQAAAFREELQAGRVVAEYHAGGDGPEGLATWVRRRGHGAIQAKNAEPSGSRAKGRLANFQQDLTGDVARSNSEKLRIAEAEALQFEADQAAQQAAEGDH